MADFTHTFTLTARLDDGRTLTMSNEKTISEVDGVWEGFVDPTSGSINGAGFGSGPSLPTDPILALLQPVSDGAEITIANSNTDNETFAPPSKAVVVINGPECFDVSSTAGDTTLAETMENIQFQNGSTATGVSYFILYGPTS